jgi:hypothetical protein
MRNFSKWGLRPSSLPVGTCFLSGAATLGVLDQFVAPSWGQLFCGFGKCNDLWSKGYRARRRMGAVCAWIRFCVHELLRVLPSPALFSPFFVFNLAAVAVCGCFHLLGVMLNIFATSSAVALAAKLDFVVLDRKLVVAWAASDEVDDSRPGRRARGPFLALPDCSGSSLDLYERPSRKRWPSRVINLCFSDSAVCASAQPLSLPSSVLSSRLPSSPLVEINARRCPSSTQEQGRVAHCTQRR